MSEIVNLRRARKTKARVAAADKAAENRLRFGVSKVESGLTAARQDIEDRRFDAHRRDREPGSENA